MQVLIVCATPPEAVLQGVDEILKPGSLIAVPNQKHTIHVLVTGVGSIATAFHLGGQLSQGKYDLAVNIGVCGAFNRSIELGSVVNIVSDCFADTGAEDDEKFLTLFDLGLDDPQGEPYKNGRLLLDEISNDVINVLPKATGISCNASSGNEKTISYLVEKYHADIESMEGAAFAWCCKKSQLPCIQVRAVSNYIEKRNRASWQMEKALGSLKTVMVNFINNL